MQQIQEDKQNIERMIVRLTQELEHKQSANEKVIPLEWLKLEIQCLESTLRCINSRIELKNENKTEI